MTDHDKALEELREYIEGMAGEHRAEESYDQERKWRETLSSLDALIAESEESDPLRAELRQAKQDAIALFYAEHVDDPSSQRARVEQYERDLAEEKKL